MFSKIAALPRKYKILIVLLCDFFLLPLALFSAVALRMGTIHPDVETYYWVFFLLPFFTIPIFLKLGLYRAVIRYVDDKIIYTVIYGVTLSVLILGALVFMFQIMGLPRSALLIYWVIAAVYIGVSRYTARSIIRSFEFKKDRRQRVAIYGAGRAGLQTAMALLSSTEFRPVVFFDDDDELHGTSVAGLRVFDPENAEAVMTQFECQQLLLAIPSASRKRRLEIIKSFEGKNIIMKTLPGVVDLVHGTVRVEDIREVGIEDLLGRDPVPPFEDLISSCIRSKNVLVTGAGGSIGSELCRQILLNLPQRLVLFEQCEFALYKIEQELRRFDPYIEIRAVLGDVQNREDLKRLMGRYEIDTVYHAAAYKHVPLVEDNCIAGLQNNVFGTMACAEAALACGVKTFVLISTDKAVRPTNVMGATKRLAEMVLQAMSDEYGTKTCFCMVRFGNVLGSSGSVVPLFKEQIKNGGPVTVTHPDITRYFMTIPEAAQLVLQASSMAKGGDVFVLDMGEPVKIVDLARKMILLSGLEVRELGSETGDISLVYTGLRPGEKLFEELLIGNNVGSTQHPRIMRAEEEFIKMDVIAEQLKEMKTACLNFDDSAVISGLKRLVKDYRKTESRLEI